MIRRPPRSTLSSSSAASDVYKRQTKSRSPRASNCSQIGEKEKEGEGERHVTGVCGNDDSWGRARFGARPPLIIRRSSLLPARVIIRYCTVHHHLSISHQYFTSSHANTHASSARYTIPPHAFMALLLITTCHIHYTDTRRDSDFLFGAATYTRDIHSLPVTDSDLRDVVCVIIT